MTLVRVFISSPGDVNEERAQTMRVIKRLQEEFAGRLTLEPVYWEHEPLLMTGTFQEQIPPPSDSDICVCILWSRLGTRLPSEKFHRADGSAYASGTEFEFENAVEAHRRLGRPDMLVYLKTAEAVVSLRDEKALLERMRQKKMLDDFLRRWFTDEHEGTLIAARHDFNTLAEFEERFEAHLRKMLEKKAPAAATTTAAPPAWQKGAPFRGLEVFEAEHAPIFCGRTRAVGDVLNALRRQAADGRAFVLITGMSGCGKSSLLRAGVLPLLIEPGVIEGVAFWREAALKPGESGRDLCDGLAGAISAALPELSVSGTGRAELAKILRESPLACGPLVKVALTLAALDLQRTKQLTTVPQARLSLLIDQLEEIFTNDRISPEERAVFAAAVNGLARSGQVWITATLRSDFYPRLVEVAALHELREGSGTYDLAAPTAAEISQIIRKPAWMAGVTFDEEAETGLSLADALCEAALRSPEALPLLEFALTELYNRCAPQGRRLTFEAYRELGGVEGALARRAEEVFLALPAEVRAAVPPVLGALVGIGLDEGATSVVRKRARIDVIAASPASRALVDAFVKARLLVVDRGADGSSVVMVAHEALLRHWPRIQEWVKENLAMLRTRARIATAETVWTAEKKAAEFLLPEGTTLNEAVTLLAQRRRELSDGDVEFIEASLQARRRRAAARRHRWIAAAAALLLLLGSVWWWWAAYRKTSVAYFEHMINRWGVLAGVDAISRSEMRVRNGGVKIVRRGFLGPVIRVETVDGRDRPNVPINGGVAAYLSDKPLDALEVRECAFTFDYKDGRVQSQKAFDAQGAQLWEFFYVATDAGFYRHDSAFAKREGVASGAAYIQFTRSPEGFDREVRFTDGRTPQPNPDGCFGFQIESDPQGFVTKVTAIDTEGKPMLLRRLGFAETQVIYDGKHRITEIRYFDAEGRPAMGTAGYVGRRNTWNDAGNLTSQAFIDDRERLVFVAAFGYAKATVGYDERQRPIATAFYSANDKLVLFKEAGFARRTERYDDRGNLSEEAFFDAADRPVVVSFRGYARATYRYDDHRRLIEETRYGADGKLHATGPESGAHFTFQYDAQGRRRRGTLFVPTREGVITETEHDVILQSYDDAGQTVEERRTDQAGRPALGPRGYSIARIARTEEGRREETSFFGIDEKPVVDSDGAHRVVWTRDEQGIIHGPRRLNLAGDPVAVAAGAAGDIDEKVQKDDRGNTTENAYVDSRGRPVLNPTYGVSRTTARYDGHGNPIEITTFGVKGEWVVGTGGEGARVTATYDARGVKVEATTDVPTSDGKLTEQEHVRIWRRFDAVGRCLEIAYFDAPGRPTVGADGWHRALYEYSGTGTLKSAASFGTDDHPAAGKHGYAKRENVFDSTGTLADSRFFDPAGAAVVVRTVVTQVVPDSVAGKAGLKVGDVLLAYAGREIHSLPYYRSLTTQPLESPERELRIRRGTDVVVLRVPAGLLGFMGFEYAENALPVRVP
jgi:hypothetical protein